MTDAKHTFHELVSDKSWFNYNKEIGIYIANYSSFYNIDLDYTRTYPVESYNHILADLFLKIMCEFYDKPDKLYRYVDKIAKEMLARNPLTFGDRIVSIYNINTLKVEQIIALKLLGINKRYNLQKLRVERCLLADARQADPDTTHYKRLEKLKETIIEIFRITQRIKPEDYDHAQEIMRLETKIVQLERKTEEQQTRIAILSQEKNLAETKQADLSKDKESLSQEILTLKKQLNKALSREKSSETEARNFETALFTSCETIKMLEAFISKASTDKAGTKQPESCSHIQQTQQGPG